MSKAQIIRLAMCILLCMPFCVVRAQSVNSNAILVVVSAKASALPNVTQRDIADLYLGRTRTLSNGQSIVAVDHGATSAIRSRFYKALTGKAITDINAYWARLLFTGQSSPPQSLQDTAAVTEAIKSNPGLIGYVEQSQVPNPEAAGLRVLLTINAP